MRVIPVIDLKGGSAVHAVRGQRERYRPLRSGLVAGSDPLRVARAFRGELGLGELYVADLDAIAGGPLHRDALAALAREARVMVDAGVTDAAAVRPLLQLGAARVVIGTETLAEPAALGRLRADLPDAPLVLSLDLRGDRVLTPDAGLGRLGAAEALALLGQSGVSEVIVLDLARVGSGTGPDVALVRDLCARFPDVELLAGGGVRDLADLCALAEAGAAGALVATALHHGAIGRGELRALRDPGGRSADDRLELLCERGRHVDARRPLDALPAGDAVDLEHVVAPVGSAHQVHAGVVGAQGGRGRHAQALLFGVEPNGPRLATARDVRAPAIAAALDGRNHPLADDQRSHVATRRAAASPGGSTRPARAPAHGTRAAATS